MGYCCKTIKEPPTNNQNKSTKCLSQMLFKETEKKDKNLERFLPYTLKEKANKKEVKPCNYGGLKDSHLPG